VNYAAFSVFAALLVTEIMGAAMLLLEWDAAKKRVLDYVIPIWEITGTFGAFWVVTGDFAFPTLLVPVAAIFSPLLAVFLILFVARNASIAFAEFIIKRRWIDDVKLYRAYALATVVLGLVVLVLLSALVGGQGVDLTAGSFSLVSWATTASVAFVLGALLLCVGLAPVFFDLPPRRNLVLPLAGAGIILSVLSYWLMSPALLTLWMAIPVILTLAGGVLYVSPRTKKLVANKAVFILMLSVIVFSLQPLIYPGVLGRVLPIDAVTTSGVMADAFVTITALGALLLAVMLGLYVRVAMRGTSGPDVAVSRADYPFTLLRSRRAVRIVTAQREV
jgi:cytochrome d ubiquinol oxidase subunit II